MSDVYHDMRIDLANALRQYDRECSARSEIEAERDRYRKALERIESIIPHQHCRTCQLYAREAQAALRDLAGAEEPPA